MSNEDIGTVRAQLTADTRTFDVSLTNAGEAFEAAGAQAEKAAAKVRAAGKEFDEAAKIQERAVEKYRRAFEKEQFAQMHAGIAADALNRQRQVAALRLDIETRAAEKAAAAQEHLNAVQENSRALLEGLGVSGLFGVSAAVEGLKEIVLGTMETEVQLGKLHHQTGISVEDLSVLKFAASETGIEFDVLTRGFKKLAVTAYEADEGNKKSAQGFAQLGISVTDLRAKGDDMYGVLKLVADKFRDMPDGIVKSDTAAKIFGARMGSELIPILNLGAKAIEDFKAQSPIFTGEDTEGGEKLHHSINELNASLGKTKIALSEQIDGPLSKYILTWTEGMETILDLGQRFINSQVNVGKYLTAGSLTGAIQEFALDSVRRPPATTGIDPSLHKSITEPPPPHGDNQKPDPDIFTLNLAHIFNEQIGEQTKIADSYRAFYAKLDADANALAEARRQQMSVQSPQLSAADTTIPEERLMDFYPPLEEKQASFFRQMGEGLDEWADKATDARAALTDFWQGLLSDTNGELVKLMTSQYHRGDWKNALKPAFTGGARKALEFGEGELFKGIGGKLGTQTNPMFVKNVDGLAGGIGGILSSSSGSSGSSSATSGVGGFLGMLGRVGKFFGFMEGGGTMSPGGFYLTGERGPELINVGSTSRIHNARDTSRMMGGGGDTHHTWNIDARGSQDPAAVRRAVNDGIMAAAPHIAAGAIRAQRDIDARRPNMGR